jgi:hypothetical protein
MDWAALHLLQLEPPIDLRVAYDPPPSTNNKPTPVKPTQRASTGGDELDQADMDDLTKHFHEGFTGQQISQSVLEDSMSLATPGRSRANSDTTFQSERDKDAPLYDDFEFVGYDGGSFECTVEQVRQFEEDLLVKNAKMVKKKKLKEKKDRERVTKEREEKRQQEEEGVGQRRREEEAQERVRQEEGRVEAAVRREARRLAREVRLKRVGEMQGAIAAHEEKVDKVQKKLKSLRKKLRDIAELEGKVASGAIAVLNSEQQGKVGKRQEVEDEEREMEEEEEGLEGCRPPAVPAELLADDSEDEEEGEGEGEVKGQGQGQQVPPQQPVQSGQSSQPSNKEAKAPDSGGLPVRPDATVKGTIHAPPIPTPTPTPTASAGPAPVSQQPRPWATNASTPPAPPTPSATDADSATTPPAKPASVPWRSSSVAAKLAAATGTGGETSGTTNAASGGTMNVPTSSSSSCNSSSGGGSSGSGSVGSWRTVAASAAGAGQAPRPTDNRLPLSTPASGVSSGISRSPGVSLPAGRGSEVVTPAPASIPAPAPAVPAAVKAAVVDEWATVASTKKKKGQ